MSRYSMGYIQKLRKEHWKLQVQKEINIQKILIV